MPAPSTVKFAPALTPPSVEFVAGERFSTPAPSVVTPVPVLIPPITT